MPQHQDEPVVETTTEARSGVTGHNVRYVLVFSLCGVIVAFVAILWYFGSGSP
jgi:Flp pilus assembly protein TadB